MFKSEPVYVRVAPERKCHEVKVKLEEQQDAGFVEKLYFLRDQPCEGGKKLVTFTVTEDVSVTGITYSNSTFKTYRESFKQISNKFNVN